MRGVMGIDDLPWEDRVRFLRDDMADEAWDWLLLKALLYRMDARDRLEREKADVLTGFLRCFRAGDLDGMEHAIDVLEEML